MNRAVLLDLNAIREFEQHSEVVCSAIGLRKHVPI
jgi:hypothetical protein